MASNKTVATTASVDSFLNSIDDPLQQNDSRQLVALMQKVSGEPPVMWGASIIGFGSARLRSPATGREIDWLKIGFSPRKGKLSLYLTVDAQRYEKQLQAMGKYKTGKGCIYLRKLSDVDGKKLEDLIRDAYKKSFSY